MPNFKLNIRHLTCIPVRKQQGLVPDPEFFRILEGCLGIISGNVGPMYDVWHLQIVFINVNTSINSVWTFGFWHINRVKQHQVLVPDPDFFWIWDSCLLIILGNVTHLHNVSYPQIWLIYLINYVNKFNLNIRHFILTPISNQLFDTATWVGIPDPERVLVAATLVYMSNAECLVWIWTFVNEISQSELEISYMMYKKHSQKSFLLNCLEKIRRKSGSGTSSCCCFTWCAYTRYIHHSISWPSF